MIKVLMIAKNLELHGITSVILSYTLNLNRKKVQVDVACGLPVNQNCAEKLKSNGSELFVLPSRSESLFKYKKELKSLLKKNCYDIVHVHGNSTTMAIELSVAKKCGVKVRIAHSHNTTCGSMLRHKLLLPFFKRAYTNAAACSKLAGNWIFGENNFTVLNNGIAVEDFKFSEGKRDFYRRQLNLADDFVIGHVGRFNSQKNHPLLLDVFDKLLQIKDNSRLLLVGDGPDFENIKNRISSSAFKDKVILYGTSDDVAGLMSAMDIFLLPSKYEGLGIVLVEAQINGLPCIVSDRVPKEVMLGNAIEFVPLDDVKDWVNAISKIEISDRNYLYKDFENRIKDYDIKNCVAFLENWYLSLFESNK